MEITFVSHAMPKVTAMGTVSFQAIVDSQYLWCEISWEALRDHFYARSLEKDDLLDAFHIGRAKIEQTARQHLEAIDGHPVLLMTTDFA
jgi:hypothetical protein